MSTTRSRPVIAIDGPAGAGKSTVAREVADRLGFVLVDTGAMYRGVALAARERGISWEDGDALGALARSLPMSFSPGEGGAPRLMVDGVDRSDDIRTPQIADGASAVSRHPPVRAALLGVQRRLGADGGVVLEGRDIGTVVFPDAEIKVFLTASSQERARRRVGDLRGRGQQADPTSVQAALEARDRQDSTRPVAPLRPADDAVQLDSTELSFDEVVARVLELARSRS